MALVKGMIAQSIDRQKSNWLCFQPAYLITASMAPTVAIADVTGGPPTLSYYITLSSSYQGACELLTVGSSNRSYSNMSSDATLALTLR